jgi:hypothetical protein
MRSYYDANVRKNKGKYSNKNSVTRDCYSNAYVFYPCDFCSIFLANVISSDLAQVDVSRLLDKAALSIALRSSSVSRIRSVLVFAFPTVFLGLAMVFECSYKKITKQPELY